MGFKIFQMSIYLVFITLVMCFAFINYKIIETFIGLLVFFSCRYSFSKTYHANNTLKCLLLSIGIFILYITVCSTVHLSLMFNILLGFTITLVLYFTKDYLDLKEVKQVKISKGINVTLLKNKCSQEGLNDFETALLVDYYVNRYSITKIALKNNYSIDNIKKIKAKLIKRLL